MTVLVYGEVAFVGKDYNSCLNYCKENGLVSWASDGEGCYYISSLKTDVGIVKNY